MSYPITEFRLITAIRTTLIDEPFTTVTPIITEPIRWSDILLIGEVDEDLKGFNYNYSDGSLMLDFTCSSSYNLLSLQYYTFGTDAKVQFQVVEIDREGNEFIEYDGLVDFSADSGFIIADRRVSASIVLNSLHTKVDARFESPISLAATQTLDSQFIFPPVEIEIPLAGQTIREKGQIKKTKLQTETASFPGAGLGGYFVLLPNMIPVAATGITPPLSVSDIPDLSTLEGVNLLYGTVTTGIDPLSNPLIPTTKYAGLYHIEFDWLFHINVSLTKGALQIGAPKFAILNFVPVAVILQPGKDKITIPMCPPASGNGFKDSVEYTFDCKLNQDFDLPAGSSVFVYCGIVSTSQKEVKQMDFTIQTINLRTRIERETRATPSVTKAYRYVDALKHVFGCITSQFADDALTGRLVGSLIEPASVTQATDGAATEYAVCNGKQLRGLSAAPTFTAKELINTVWAHNDAGLLYEKDPTTGAESIRIEPGEWFYRGGEILELTEVYSYTETPDKSLIFNKIRVGYETYMDSGAGVLEEFNTERTYQTPIVNQEATLEILCKLIGAGTAIEEARRLGVAAVNSAGVSVPTTSDAGTYDDSGFLLHVAAESYVTTVRFIVEGPTARKPYIGNYVQFSASKIGLGFGGMSLKVGDTIVIQGTGTANDGKFFTIVGVDARQKTAPTYQIFYQDLVAGGPYSATFSIQGRPVKLRTNERLNTEGIADPENTPNQELSPARMLRKHWMTINSGLYYKKITDKLILTAYKDANSNMVTQVKDAFPALQGDSYKQYVWETRDISLGDLELFDRPFKPELINATVKLTRTQLRALFDAMQNRGDDEKRLGYISLLNPDGEIVSGYLRKISYKRSEQTATIVLRKKKPADIGVPHDCLDFYSWQYGQYPIDPLRDKDRLLFCTFGVLLPS